MPLVKAEATWSSPVTLSTNAYLQCKAGTIVIAYGPPPLAEPSSKELGIDMGPGDVLPLPEGLAFRVVRANAGYASYYYQEFGV